VRWRSPRTTTKGWVESRHRLTGCHFPTDGESTVLEPAGKLSSSWLIRRGDSSHRVEGGHNRALPTSAVLYTTCSPLVSPQATRAAATTTTTTAMRKGETDRRLSRHAGCRLAFERAGLAMLQVVRFVADSSYCASMAPAAPPPPVLQHPCRRRSLRTRGGRCAAVDPAVERRWSVRDARGRVSGATHRHTCLR